MRYKIYMELPQKEQEFMAGSDERLNAYMVIGALREAYKGIKFYLEDNENED